MCVGDVATRYRHRSERNRLINVSNGFLRSFKIGEVKRFRLAAAHPFKNK